VRDRAALRLAGELAGVIAACAVAVALADDRPPLPPDVCSGDGAPAYTALLADGELSVAAVIGRLDREPAWNARALADALLARGFAVEAPGRFARDGVVIDVVEVADDRPAVDAALAVVLDRDVIYYNGHEYRGELRALAAPPHGAHVLVLDTCWSTQRYSARLVGAPGLDVVGNTERAVTGSVASFVALLDGLRARHAWGALLDAMNASAAERARERVRSPFPRPERYRLDVACGARPRAPEREDRAVAIPVVAW